MSRAPFTSKAIRKLTTTRLLNAAREAPSEPSIFWLKPVAPFRLELTVWALRRRANNLIDRWDGQTYRRVLVFGGQPVEVAVTQKGSPEARRLQVTPAGKQLAKEAAVRTALERLLGLRLDLSEFYRLAAREPKLGALVERFRGVKPPRFPTLFEALANAVACQQMSLTLGILLLSRLTQKFGLPAPGTAGPALAFPRPGSWQHWSRPISARSASAGKRRARSLH